MTESALAGLEDDFTRQITDYFEYRIKDEDDFRFLHKKADYYLTQFFFPIYQKEILELEPEDRTFFWTASLIEQTGLDFQVQEETGFIQLTKESLPSNTRIFIDLTNPLLGIIYFQGTLKNCQSLNKQLLLADSISPYSISSDLLLRFSKELNQVNELKLTFEQLPDIFGETNIFKTHWKSADVQSLMSEYAEKMPAFFHISLIGGHAPDHLQSLIQADDKGTISTQHCRLSLFLSLVKHLKEQYLEQVQSLSKNYKLSWEPDDSLQRNFLKGQAVEFVFPERIQNPEKLVNHLISGTKPFHAVGLKERVSRELWSVNLVDIQTGHSLDLDVTAEKIKVYAWHSQSLPFIINLQNLLQQVIDARIKVSYV